jgi:CubicO group peptidase (beta-lactamase class C family)
MILVERGKLLHRYALGFFPEFHFDAQRITIKQLLNHTSGILDYSLVWGESKQLKGNVPRDSANVVRFVARQNSCASARSEMGIQ